MLWDKRGRARWLRGPLAASLLLVTLVVWAGAAEPGEEYQVFIKKDTYRFEPVQLVVEAGDTVRWINEDERRHLTASIPDGSGHLEIFCPELYPGKVCTHTFTQPGKYPYFCFIHRNMVGEVVVVP